MMGRTPTVSTTKGNTIKGSEKNMNEKVYVGDLLQNTMGEEKWVEHRQSKATHELIIVGVHRGSLYFSLSFCICLKLSVI